jgi:hypothetical protein
MVRNFAITALLFALVIVTGCSDSTLPHRQQLALCIIKSNAPLELDFDSIAPEMHRMQMGAASARRTAELLEEFLATSPRLDAELLDLVGAYAKSERKLEAQFKAAVDDGRPELVGEELDIALNCAKAGMMLRVEICERIEFDSLVTISP